MIKKYIVNTLKNTKLNNYYNQNKTKHGKKQSPQKRSVKVMPPQAKNTFLQMQEAL